MVEARVYNFVDISSLNVNTIRLMVTRILLRARTTFFSSRFGVSQKVNSMGITYVRVVGATIFRRSDDIYNVLRLCGVVGVVVGASISPFRVKVRRVSGAIGTISHLISRGATTLFIPYSLPIASTMVIRQAIPNRVKANNGSLSRVAPLSRFARLFRAFYMANLRGGTRLCVDFFNNASRFIYVLGANNSKFFNGSIGTNFRNFSNRSQVRRVQRARVCRVGVLVRSLVGIHDPKAIGFLYGKANGDKILVSDVCWFCFIARAVRYVHVESEGATTTCGDDFRFFRNFLLVSSSGGVHQVLVYGEVISVGGMFRNSIRRQVTLRLEMASNRVVCRPTGAYFFRIFPRFIRGVFTGDESFSTRGSRE